jgi:tetratricopeptide (TPR) repeat protein
VAAAALAFSGITAVQEQRAAQRRFDDLRHFANFALNDLDGSLREGTTKARAALVTEGLKYLGQLAGENPSPSILRDLVDGYIKVGDLQGNLYVASLGETAVAESSYRKALQHAEALLRAEPSNMEDQQSVVLARIKLGQVLAATGNRSEALQQYGQALSSSESTLALHPAKLDRLLDSVNLWSLIGSARSLNSDAAGAVQDYRRMLAAAGRLPDTYANKPVALAMAREQIAYWGRLAGESTGGEEVIHESIAEYRRAIKLKSSPARLRNLGKALKNLADLDQRDGFLNDALASIRESAEIARGLLAQDPDNVQNRIDLQQALMPEIAILQAKGLRQEAHDQTRRALDMMKPFADDPDAPYQHAADYAELLATTPFPDLRDDAAAVRYARNAVAKTHEIDLDTWHVLSLACERAGDHAQALEADRRAVALRGQH